ncbi:hypothetical protein P152DRAFT_181671 [Eremomyces bilateralis CBS 781.70]|uniref:Uncharacterized protein n=1 Tax=Eremomyces bilateralis CBS 781.70 TaxID=1392243 RepID=A0A6G1GBU3_9PEZI|nr:uncharacterized protein P152DRAFT_181671 [Eremomyces bilateralis CBS 781.70]KAF1815309.1 hypothetical protein P152DRAFT_181671 [Eremomyces bilateralis CBS 781.70]
MSDRSIRDIAESCDDAFDNLLDRNFVATWPVKFHDLVEKLEEERARFGVWAAHIGAQAEHHASLDYRLRESEKVQSLVKSQLLALHSSLVRLPENLMKEGNNYRDCDTSYKAYKESHTEVPPEARSLPDSEPTSSEEDDLADQHEDFHRSRNAISRLNRLARAIRQRSIVSQTSKAVNFRPRNEEGNDEIEAFEQFCFAVIQSKWRNADESLQKRLAKVNASRRRLFLYRMKHQKVLGSRRRSSAKSKSSLPLQEVQLTHSTAAPLQQTSIISEEPPMIEDKPGSAMEESVAKASSFVESKFQPDTSSKASTSIGGTSVGSVFGRSRFPPPPYIPESRAEFECPYCCQLTSTRMLAKGHWK